MPGARRWLEQRRWDGRAEEARPCGWELRMPDKVEFALVHGGGQGSWVWDETRSALHSQTAGAGALALDVPGCGAKRGRRTQDLTLEDVARELVADIEAGA